jgi:phosphoglycerol transferase MdoB-like AlkP superfamily enzyme
VVVERETWIPIAGFVSLFLAGTVMLYATSGPPGAPQNAPARAAKANKNAKKPPVQLTSRRMVDKDRPAAKEGAPNLVFVIACAHRRDRWSPYGGSEVVTPYLKEFASQGVTFDDALATSSWTKSAVTALWTGQHAVDIGMIQKTRKPNEVKLAPEIETLAERLIANGYYTMVVNSSPAIARSGSGLFQGFDRIQDAHPQGFKAKNRLRSLPGVEKGFQMLDQRKDGEKSRPFYLQLILSESHKPVQVPPAEFNLFTSTDERIAPYLATVHRFDKAVAALDAGLKERGLDDNTLVVILADHGEGLGIPAEHGKAHGRALYGSTIRVGWLMRGPSIPAGKTVGGLASGVDVMPTVLGLLGVNSPADIAGKDWSKQARGEIDRTTRGIAFADTWFYSANRASIWTASHQCQQDFGSVDLSDAFQDGCFDRAKDPDFATPIAIPELTAKLVAWRAANTTEPESKKDREETKELPVE